MKSSVGSSSSFRQTWILDIGTVWHSYGYAERITAAAYHRFFIYSNLFDFEIRSVLELSEKE